MRSVFLISAIVLHISWCYAYPAFPGGSWMPGYFNPYGNYGMPNFINSFKLPDKVTDPNKVNGLSDEGSKPGASGVQGPPDGFYSISHSSFVTSMGNDGKVHTDGETVINHNGQITKFKY